MDGKQLLDIAKGIENIETQALPKLIEEIRATYKVLKEDLNTLGNCLFHMANNIMRIADVKPEAILLYEQIIDDIIICSIENQYQVGFDAMRVIFNSGSEFYKKADLETSLKFPLGRDRPLKKYKPSVGEQCDVVRPYITSTSYCGWVRCTVLQIQGDKYTVLYANTPNPTTLKQLPFFAPLGTRTFNHNWRQMLKVGTPIEAQLNRVWYESTVMQIQTQNGCKRAQVSFRRFDKNGDRQDPEGNRYFGLGPNQDQWMDIMSPRIQCPGSMANKKLCYYTATSQQILPDDNYDIIFKEEYQSKPFHAIMRNIFCRSLSFLRFMNTFAENQGFQVYLSALDNPNANPDALFSMQANIGCMVTLIPRMDVDRYLPQVYQKTYAYFKNNAKSLTPNRIDQAYFCIDMIGRRLFSLTEVYKDQYELRKHFIKIFLKMNMQKQMLALRYLYDLINPKKPYSTQERQDVDNFIICESIFQQIFQLQTHEQILSRTTQFLKYLIERKIVKQQQIQYLWNLAPQSDQRGRAVIEKIFSELSKMLPIQFVQNLLGKLLNLKETQLTFDSLNLLRELKNRQITSEYQLKILSYLWDIITMKSFNIKTNIEQEVQKVFKVFVSGIQSPELRMNVLKSMSQRISETKRISGDIDLLKDFIMSYPTQIVKQVESTQAPLTIYDAINFLKSQNIYEKLLNLIISTKKDQTVADLLRFLGFLFQYDAEDASNIIKPIYDKLGPSDILLEWIYKNLKKAYVFVDQMLQSFDKMEAFANLSISGFEALREIILEINERQKKLKIMTTYKYSASQTGSTQTKQSTTQTNQKAQTQKMIGPVLPEKSKHLYILVSPFQLKGMKFLNNLLHLLKNSRVYDEAVKLIIQFIVRLDDSLEDKTEQYRKEFLSEIIKQIDALIKKNEINDAIKQQIQVYINLFIEIFAETEKYGIGDITPHFENLRGQKLTLNIENNFVQPKEKRIEKFVLVVNENDTIWRLKKKISEVIQEATVDIDVVKFVNPIDDGFNGKSLMDLFFYDGESIKISKKTVKEMPKHNLLNEDGTDVSQRFFQIISEWFNESKNTQNHMRIEELKKLAQARWRGSLFRQQDKLEKIMEEYDIDKKGYLTFENFKQFFYSKSVKNQHAIWKIIHLSGYKNNLKQNVQEHKQINVNHLPRKILSSPEVYELIFRIFKSPTFKDVQLNFYRLLSQLQVDESTQNLMQTNIYQIIEQSDSIYEFCYALEVANSSIVKRGQFFYKFWENKGCEKILERIKKLLAQEETIYKMQIQIKNTVFPNLIKTLNYYQRFILMDKKTARFLASVKLNVLDIEDLIKKLKEFKESEEQLKQEKIVQEKLLEINKQINHQQLYKVATDILSNLIKNFTSDSSDFLPKMTVQVVRLIGFIVVSKQQLFNPQQLLYGTKSQSLNYRRTACNIIYLYIQENQIDSEELLLKLLEEMPFETKHIYSNYYGFLAKIVELYLEKYMKNTERDQFFIQLTNNLLDKLFNNIEGETRTAIIGDKVITGVLSTIQILLKKDTVCTAIKHRKHELTEKCLFSYDINKKIDELQVTPEMLCQSKQSQHFKNYVMCKTQETREIVYRIIAKLHQITAEEDLDYIEKFIFPIFEIISDDVRLTDSKSLNVGLKNFGSTCYMNSMLQVLNAVEPFRNYLMQAEVGSELVKQLKNTFSALFFSERIDYAPQKVLQAFVPPINPGIQQDTTQFLNLLFDQLESGLGESKYRSLLNEIFKGALIAQMICSTCGAKKQNREQFFSYSIEIDGKYQLAQALEGAHEGEIISDYFCQSCQKKGDMKKRSLLSQVPNIFFIHLRRIVFNYDMFVNMKIHTRLQFPNQLNIEPYTKEGVELRQSLGLQYIKNLAHNEQEMKKYEQMTLHGREKDYYKLQLKGVIVHSGSADVGHYYSILSNGKTWHKFDDSRISVFTMSGFENQVYGGTWTNQQWGGFGSSVNGYFLVYEKVVKSDLKFYKLPSHDTQQIEEQIQVKYEDTKIYNTVEQYKSVWLDNHRFMVETQLLQTSHAKEFMKFICNILKQKTKSNKIQLISYILYKIVFYSEEIGDLLEIFNRSTEQINPDIFYRFVINDKKKTFKLLFSHNRKVRSFMAAYLSTILIKIYQNPSDDKDKKEVLDFISEYMNNMTGQIAKNWLRIDGFFEMICFLVAASSMHLQLWQFFLKYNLISTMIDFVMEKSSPVKINPKNYSLGTKTNPVNFTAPLQLIAYLLKASFGLTGVNYELPQPSAQLLYHLNDNDVICLSCSEFYRKMLKQRQNLKALGLIIQRLCIKNLPYSRMIAEVLLQAIGSITDMNDQMQDLSSVLLQILMIRDEYWEHRAEMMLGVSSPYVLEKNTMSTLDEERYIYTSTIYDIFPVESIFGYVYLYRLKNSLACFYLIKAFLEGCSVTDFSKQYLIKQPSPSYYYRDYLHWIEEFLTSFLGFLTVTEKVRERVQQDITTALKYVQDYKKYKTQSNACIYESIITGQILEKKQIYKVEQDGIQLVINEFEVYCLESEPACSTNKTLEAVLDNGRLTQPIDPESTILKFIKNPKKGIALKAQPVQQGEDAQLVGLFEEEFKAKDTVGTQTINTPVQINQRPETKMQEQIKNEPQVIQKEKEQKKDEKLQVVNIDGFFTASYFRQIQVVNLSKSTKIVRLEFNKEQNANFIMPLEFTFKISMKSNESLWISKQNYSKNWEPINFKIFVEEYSKQKHDRKVPKINWFRLYHYESNNNFEQGQKKEDMPQPMIDQKQENNANRSGVDNNFEIQCPICTFINESIKTECEMCGSNLH